MQSCTLPDTSDSPLPYYVGMALAHGNFGSYIYSATKYPEALEEDIPVYPRACMRAHAHSCLTVCDPHGLEPTLSLEFSRQEY